MREDNTVFVLQKAIETHHIKVTKNSVKEFLVSHPLYPSLKSVCDGLKNWNIDHYPLKLSKQEILEVEPPYIAHIGGAKGQLAFVEKSDAHKVTFTVNKGKEAIQNREEFSKKLSGGVILLDPNPNSGEANYREKRQNELVQTALIPSIVISFVLYGLYIIYTGSGLSLVQERIPVLLFITKAIGITASVFLVLHEFNIHTRIADKICGFNSGIDCDSVLSSDVSRIFGDINLADVGIIYFTSTLMYVLGVTTEGELWFLAAISTVSIVFPVYSIYYQGFRIGKWCPYCLIVQVVLIAEFIVLFPLLSSITIFFVDVLRLAVLFAMVAAVWILYKSYYELTIDYSNERYSFLRFKSNPGIFKFLLQGKGRIDIPKNHNDLVFGNPNAALEITVFLSLHCKPCIEAFKNIDELLQNENELRINFIFSLDHELLRKIFAHIYWVYNYQGKDQAYNLLKNWYFGTKIQKQQHEHNWTNSNKLLDLHIIEEKNVKLFKKANIKTVPKYYVNGYNFPSEYDIKLAKLFLNEIIDNTITSPN